VWPLFGTTNQLLAALVLLVIYLWVRRQNYKNKVAILLPTIFMLLVTISALGYSLYVKLNKGIFDVITIIAGILFLLSIFVVFETLKHLKEKY
jgi:carbon starvation protein